jgi:hypothetical protein
VRQKWHEWFNAVDKTSLSSRAEIDRPADWKQGLKRPLYSEHYQEIPRQALI